MPDGARMALRALADRRRGTSRGSAARCHRPGKRTVPHRAWWKPAARLLRAALPEAVVYQRTAEPRRPEAAASRAWACPQWRTTAPTDTSTAARPELASGPRRGPAARGDSAAAVLIQRSAPARVWISSRAPIIAGHATPSALLQPIAAAGRAPATPALDDVDRVVSISIRIPSTVAGAALPVPPRKRASSVSASQTALA